VETLNPENQKAKGKNQKAKIPGPAECPWQSAFWHDLVRRHPSARAASSFIFAF
jgi:hypothetical protein